MAIVSAVQGIREEIATRLNENEVDNTDTYTNWINLSLADIESDFPRAPYLQTSADFTLSSGVRVYSTGILPTNFSKFNGITLPQNNTKLAYVTPEQFDIIRPSATEGGNPTIYTIRGNQSSGVMEFFPVPGSAFTVHMDIQIQMPTVSAGSATLIVPTKYIELPVLYGEAKGLRRRGKYTEAQIVETQYQQLKERMKDDLYLRVTESQRLKSVREFTAVDRAYDDPIKNVFWGDRAGM